MRSSPCFRCSFLLLVLALLAAPAFAGPGEVPASEGGSFLQALWEAVLDAVTGAPLPDDPPKGDPDDDGDRGSEMDPDG